MANSMTYEWSEAKGSFAVLLDGKVITYTTTEEGAEDYIRRVTGTARTTRKPTPTVKEA